MIHACAPVGVGPVALETHRRATPIHKEHKPDDIEIHVTESNISHMQCLAFHSPPSHACPMFRILHATVCSSVGAQGGGDEDGDENGGAVLGSKIVGLDVVFLIHTQAIIVVHLLQ